jgi:hypothetical protein
VAEPRLVEPVETAAASRFVDVGGCPCHAGEVSEDDYAEEDVAFVRHLESLGVPHPYGSPDARGLGLDRNTEEGALLAFSGALRPDKPSHRAVAWILLAAFGIPVVLALVHVTGELLGMLVG